MRCTPAHAVSSILSHGDCFRNHPHNHAQDAAAELKRVHAEKEAEEAAGGVVKPATDGEVRRRALLAFLVCDLTIYWPMKNG